MQHILTRGEIGHDDRRIAGGQFNQVMHAQRICPSSGRNLRRLGQINQIGVRTGVDLLEPRIAPMRPAHDMVRAIPALNRSGTVRLDQIVTRATVDKVSLRSVERYDEITPDTAQKRIGGVLSTGEDIIAVRAAVCQIANTVSASVQTVATCATKQGVGAVRLIEGRAQSPGMYPVIARAAFKTVAPIATK